MPIQGGPAFPATGRPPVRNRIVSHYRIEELAGEGCAGQVFRALDTDLGRPVALKFLRPELAADPDVLERFLREARLAATLDDEHVCTVHAIERDQDGSWYIAMSWYDGGTLAGRLAEGPIAPRQALAWAHQTALGLAEAHRHGIVHRDIKPANLILDEKEQVRILDFGVARLQDSARLTRSGSLTGTVAYMAPEQARGEEGSAASDIWSAGVVLHEMLAGQRPFAGAYDAALLYAIVHGTPAPLPRELGDPRAACQAIVDRCLAKEPQDRYGSAEELAADLGALLDGDRRLPARRRRRRLATAAAAALLLFGVAVGVGFGPRLMPVLGLAAEPAGVAVLGVAFAGGDPDDQALGTGYGWFLSDRLSRLERAGGSFWIVPAGEVLRYGVANESEAHRILGVRRTLAGHGRRVGSTLTIDFVYQDTRTGRQETRRYSDDVANLRTWQQEVPVWAAGLLDERSASGAPAQLADGSTTVPAAFLAWVRGVGLAWDRRSGDDPQQLERAVAQLTEAVTRDSSLTCAQGDLWWARQRLAGPDDAAAAAQALAALAELGRRDPRATWPLLHAAGLAGRLGRHGEAVDTYDQVLAREPDNHAGLLGRATALVAAGRLAEAAEPYARALQRRPGYAPLLLQAARYWYELPDYARAEELAVRAAEVAPEHYFAHALLGAARFEQGDFAGATAAFHRSAACKPNALAAHNLGTIAYYEGRYADAAGYYRAALDFGQSHTGWKLLGEAWRWMPDHADSSRLAYAKAIVLARGELAGQPQDRDLQAVLATYHTARGDRAEAEQLVAAIGAAAPDLGCEGMFHLAVACEDLGRRAEALGWLERAFACGLPTERPERYPGFGHLRADAAYRDMSARYRSPS